MSKIVKDPPQLYRIVDTLWHQTVRKPDFYQDHPESYLETSHYFHRMMRIDHDFHSELRQDFRTGEMMWRGQFRLKVVHVMPKDFNVVPADDGPHFEPEYVALRYTARNHRVRYVDWEHNPKDWT